VLPFNLAEQKRRIYGYDRQSARAGRLHHGMRAVHRGEPRHTSRRAVSLLKRQASVLEAEGFQVRSRQKRAGERSEECAHRLVPLKANCTEQNPMLAAAPLKMNRCC